MTSDLAELIGKRVEWKHGRPAEGAGDEKTGEPAPVGQPRENGEAEHGDFIDHDGKPRAQRYGAPGAVPVDLAEQAGADAQHREQRHGVGPGGGAGEIIEGGGNEDEGDVS